MSTASHVDLHPVKTEVFDTAALRNTDPKGIIREVEQYQQTDFGLYMARGANHPEFGYLESWLLPSLRLRVNIFHFREGKERPQDFYIDVADIAVDGQTWTTRDLYVDLVSLRFEPVEVLDIDELAAATSAGMLSAEDAERAIEATLRAVEGITRHGDDPMAWLASEGMELSWQQPDAIELMPAQ